MLTSPRISRVLVTFCDLVFLKLPVGSPVLPISLVRQPSKQPKSSLQDSIIFSLIERSQYRVNSWRPNTKNWIPNQFAFPLGVGFKNNVFLVYLGKWSTLTYFNYHIFSNGLKPPTSPSLDPPIEVPSTSRSTSNWGGHLADERRWDTPVAAAMGKWTLFFVVRTFRGF